MTSPARPRAATLKRALTIFAEQVRHLYRFSVPAYVGAFLCALVVVGALRGVRPGWLLPFWAVAIVGVAAARSW